MLIVERGSEQWEDAWKRLLAEGHFPEHFMLMGYDEDESRYAFKHGVTRKYVYV